MEKIKRIVLAYSGGLDTSVILHWLIKEYNAEVVAFIADLGQEEDFNSAEKKAYKLGAKKVFLENLKEEFVRDFVFPMLRTNAVYEGYLLGTSIARPIIAKKQMEVAKKVKADAVSHGATGKGNDQVRFELTYYSFNPQIKVIAPWRIWDMKSRSDLIEYALKHSIPVEATRKKPYSTDRNLFHVSHEGGILEDPAKAFPPDILEIITPPEKAPDKPEVITIDYVKGNPVALNERKMSPATLLRELNKIGGKHGVGIADLVENRFVGMKSRGVYETPGGTILHVAHRALESITLDREVMRIRDSLIPKYAELVYYGFWFSPEREMLQTAMDRAQENVTGRVHLKIYKGNVYIVGRESSRSIFRKEVSSFEADKIYDQKDASGFIRINALRLILNKLSQKN
jgi:argininosuccinate synthase